MRVRWSDAARRDVVDIIEHIARFDPAAARRVRDRIRGCVAGVREHPQIGRMVPELGTPAIRERVVGPYRVMYLLRAQEVLVLTVLHGRQVAGPDDDRGSD